MLGLLLAYVGAGEHRLGIADQNLPLPGLLRGLSSDGPLVLIQMIIHVGTEVAREFGLALSDVVVVDF